MQAFLSFFLSFQGSLPSPRDSNTHDQIDINKGKNLIEPLQPKKYIHPKAQNTQLQ